MASNPVVKLDMIFNILRFKHIKGRKIDLHVSYSILKITLFYNSYPVVLFTHYLELNKEHFLKLHHPRFFYILI